MSSGKELKSSPISEANLDPYRIRNISESVQDPLEIDHVGEVRFETFRVKTPDSLYDPNLGLLLAHARGTYDELYGDVPPLDVYDDKSWTYAVRALYPYRNGIETNVQTKVQEWFSLRFVPLLGEPQDNEDFDFYEIDMGDGEKQSLLNAMMSTRSDLSQDPQELKASIITQSRFCAIRPIPVDRGINGNMAEFAALMQERHIPTRNGWSGLGFAYMNRAFLKDHRNSGYALMTCQMHPNLSDRILSYPPGTGQLTMPFTKAHEFLGLNQQDVHLARRRDGVYAYDYPAYFLEYADLAKTLMKLATSDVISFSTVEAYLPSGRRLIDVVAKPHMRDFRNIGRLLTWQGTLPESKITGEQLREILDHEVPDGPILRIMEIHDWEKGVNEMIGRAKEIASQST